MKALVGLVLSLAWNVLAYGDVADASRSTGVTLRPGDIVGIKPGEEVARESFVQDWGQFEVLIPKERFPIAAPNCRKNVILRMPGVPPDARARESQIEARWRIFKSLHDLSKSKIERLEVSLASGPYMNVDKSGRATLQYCNAYFSVRAGE